MTAKTKATRKPVMKSYAHLAKDDVDGARGLPADAEEVAGPRADALPPAGRRPQPAVAPGHGHGHGRGRRCSWCSFGLELARLPPQSRTSVCSSSWRVPLLFLAALRADSGSAPGGRRAGAAPWAAAPEWPVIDLRDAASARHRSSRICADRCQPRDRVDGRLWRRALHGVGGVLRPGVPYDHGAAGSGAPGVAPRARVVHAVPRRSRGRRFRRSQAGRHASAVARGDRPRADAGAARRHT